MLAQFGPTTPRIRALVVGSLLALGVLGDFLFALAAYRNRTTFAAITLGLAVHPAPHSKNDFLNRCHDYVLNNNKWRERATSHSRRTHSMR